MDDWDTVTKIGSKTKGGAGQRETVVRGKAALNAAQRSGQIVATEKKFAAGNTSDKAASGEGQRLTKVDRSDDIIAPQKLDTKIAEAIKNRRAQEGFKLTQAQLAQKVNAQANDIKLLESGTAIKNQALLNKVARVLKISPKTGEPLVDKH
ncbi:Endothelial differentiation- factor 1 [Lambiella insularis]|nr:Endothelial differentiation- factor 1 [Lambiella insularis]